MTGCIVCLRFCGRNHPEGSGIVYCLSRDNTETVAATVRGRGFPKAVGFPKALSQARRVAAATLH